MNAPDGTKREVLAKLVLKQYQTVARHRIQP